MPKSPFYAAYQTHYIIKSASFPCFVPKQGEFPHSLSECLPYSAKYKPHSNYALSPLSACNNYDGKATILKTILMLFPLCFFRNSVKASPKLTVRIFLRSNNKIFYAMSACWMRKRYTKALNFLFVFSYLMPIQNNLYTTK